MSWVSGDAAGISYLERAGEGEALVLLHGIGSQGASFTPLLGGVTGRVIAWNAPGYGESEALAEDWPIAADYARALERFLDALGLGRVALLGHSLGALMAASFAAGRRERVSRLVLASPALGHAVPRGQGLSPAAQARIDDLEREGPEAFAAARAARLVHAPEDNPGMVAQVRKAMSQVRLPGYAQAARMLAAGRLLDDAERLAVPTDVIVGEGDLVTPPEGARRVHEALRGAARGSLSIVPGAGHAIYLQAPGAVATVLAGVRTGAEMEGTR